VKGASLHFIEHDQCAGGGWLRHDRRRLRAAGSRVFRESGRAGEGLRFKAPGERAASGVMTSVPIWNRRRSWAVVVERGCRARSRANRGGRALAAALRFQWPAPV